MNGSDYFLNDLLKSFKIPATPGDDEVHIPHEH